MPHTRKQTPKPDCGVQQTNVSDSNVGETEPPGDINRARRRLHDFLSFWMICQEKGCKRARACRGDTEACSRRHQPLVPPDIKAWLHKAIALRLDGLSPEDAARGADEFVARYEARQAEIDARLAGARGDDAQANSQKSEAIGNDADSAATPHRDAPSPRVRAL
jgi:hypothetical protein